MKKVQDLEQFKDYVIEPEKFQPAEGNEFKDKKFETKPIGYLQDAFRRFRKNKGSVVAGIVILILVLYAIIAPFCLDQNYQNSYLSNIYLKNYEELTPRAELFANTGFWNGKKTNERASRAVYDIYRGVEIETGHEVVELKEIYVEENKFYKKTNYSIVYDTYTGNEAFTRTLTYDEYKKLQDWQDANGIQVILPSVQKKYVRTNLSIWYVTEIKADGTVTMNAVYKDGTVDPSTGVGEFIPAYNITDGKDQYTSSMRIASDPYLTGDLEHAYSYANRTGTAANGYSYTVRVDAYNYFIYMYGFEPSFLFGTDSSGFDIFTRLARGARFSLILAVCVSVINLFIGAVYGAIEGYYGGAIDIIMERISDILYNVPFTVVAILFSLHLSDRIGMVGSLFFAFISTGWLGEAASVRMQFYRFKNQEYVLAARTLGASDFRIITKHIFPNSLGTLITSSVLVIPGVIFSETSLTYLNIINLDSATRSSVGAMLSNGQAVMTKAPHVIFFPALFIALLEISFNLLGNGLRDAFNPALRGAED